MERQTSICEIFNNFSAAIFNTRCWNVPGFKGAVKGLVGGPTFCVLLQDLEKLKDCRNKGMNKIMINWSFSIFFSALPRYLRIVKERAELWLIKLR